MQYLLYNDCWHGFWVCSWWPHVLWQAVMLWLVNTGMAVCRSRPVKQVCNRRRPHDMRTTQSDLDCQSSQNRVKPVGSRSEVFVSSLMIRLARRCKRWHLQAPGRRYGARRSPLSEYVSPSISQTYNKLCASFENKIRKIYLYKEVCFLSLIEVRSLSLFLVGSMRSIQHVQSAVISFHNKMIWGWV